MRAQPYTQVTPSSLLHVNIIKHSQKLMMLLENHKSGKYVFAWEYRKSPAFAWYHIFAPFNGLERYMKDAIYRFLKNKEYDSIMAATNLFGDIINIQSFEDRCRRTCRLILAHVLVELKCSLFALLLNSFHITSGQ